MYTVTHLPSTNAVTNVRSQREAKALIIALAGVEGLDQTSPPSSALSAAWAIVSSPPVPPRPRKPRKVSPKAVPRYPLAPQYRPGFTPTARQRLLDTKLATALALGLEGRGSGYQEQASAAIAAHWREEIMVRVVPGLLLESDVPSSSALPGTATKSSPGPREFKRSYNALLEIGDRLRAGSLKFKALWMEGEAFGWDEERVARWEKLDARYIALVWEGWQTWGLAAVCFDRLPQEFQARVVAKLGHIGSHEHGWHDLGIKTFLRHPEIREIAGIRRRWREREARGEFDV